MQLVRFQTPAGPQYGELSDEGVRPLQGDPFGAYELTTDVLETRDLQLLAPVPPRQILAVGLNYASHLQGRPRPEKPEMFWKPPSAVIGPDEAIVIPPGATDVHAEGELVVVIGRTARRVTVGAAMDHVFGFTIGNDVSERAWQQQDKQWWRAKGCDTFAPIGPVVRTDFDWRCGRIATTINGQEVQAGDLADLLFDVPTIVAFASAHVTLMPGDLIFTGTPGHTRALQAGDRVVVTVVGIGALGNTVSN